MLSAFKLWLALACVFCMGISAHADLEEDLVIYFSFDKIDGPLVVNGANRDINGYLEWEAHPAPGYVNMGVMLNPYADEETPGNDFVRVRADNRINVTDQFTIAVWAKAFNFGTYRSIMANTDNSGYALCIDDRRPSFWIHISGQYLILVGDTILKENVWHHLALTFDGANAILYLNGEVELTGMRKGPIKRSQSDFFIGGEPLYQALDNSWPAWHGVLDEFYFYSRALTRDEIGLLMDRASGRE